MNKAIPKIKETAEEIREMLKNESQVKRQNRLQVREVSELVTEGLKSFSAEAMSSITSFEYLMTAWLSAIA